MLNQAIIVGRLTDKPEIKNLENDKIVTNIILAVPRSFKNAEGNYDTDFIRCILWNAVASNTAEYCKKGDIVGIKGRIQTNNYENENGEKKYSTEIVAEKVTFLSSSNPKNKCKYCGKPNKNSDPDVLCEDCRETFGHSFYSEL